MALTDQRIVVIGGSSGMGLATAQAAAEAGAVVTIASSSRERVEAARAGLPDNCDGVVLDVRDEAAVADLFADIGELDHVVFTAGDQADRRALKDLPLAEARRGFEVRLWGAVAVAKHASPRIRPGGSITLTSGTASVRPIPGAPLASAGTAATEGLVLGLAVDLAPVRVNAVRAGAVRTPLWDAIPEPQRAAVLGNFAKRALTGAVGEPGQIAAAHLYLMENQFVTGTVLTVDGGLVLTGN
ncbi:SDR family oxidoreductase [Actinospica durhamensis]|uniref:SDR family oxidoreductase n=1 Tax=Actinospica durhamensis TaxID=1508375 RepID=A0A941EV13_9ACTN|nr:SDR family oxidoreductase [Actinospica durhamensis]MBR7834424.1 SDR family oxidoreductase [Actinospica durhamensis]